MSKITRRQFLSALMIALVAAGSLTLIMQITPALLHASPSSSTPQVIGKNPNTIILTPNVTSYKLIAPNCYSAVVNMTAFDNATIPETLHFQSFFIVIILPSQAVANTTNTSFFSPNNQINDVVIFPSISVLLLISFNNICLPPGTQANNDIKLAFFNGVAFRSWSVVTITASTITWS